MDICDTSEQPTPSIVTDLQAHRIGRQPILDDLGSCQPSVGVAVVVHAVVLVVGAAYGVRRLVAAGR